MTDEISRVWILEQFEKIKESNKKDFERIYERLDKYVTIDVFNQRHINEENEFIRVDDRIDEMDKEIDETKVGIDKKWDQLNKWMWWVVSFVLTQLVGIIIILLTKK